MACKRMQAMVARKLQAKKNEQALLLELRAVLEAGLRALRLQERGAGTVLPAIPEPNWSPEGWDLPGMPKKAGS